MLCLTKFSSEVYNSKNLKKALKYANKNQADFALIIGEEEIKKDSYSIKNLKTGTQELVKESSILEYFNEFSNSSIYELLRTIQSSS